MTWLRPRGGPADALPALLLLLLLWPPATRGMICPAPTSVEHADIRVKSYTVHSRERYVCNTGFKRKAGTSSLTECVFNNTTNTTHWTTPNLKCIRDPSLAQKKLPPSTAATAGVTPQPETPSPSGKDANPSSSRDVIMSSISVVMLCVLIAVLPPLCRMIRSRQTPRRRHSVEIETVEALPMNNSREEDDGETGPHNL
ncbi:interleukin-15 receptor subunit alpha isoform X2 [Nycticebus coucang]|uniref:interleukin-15 receptor subunit alpha isoform X2 n=1 Tax=Nycticebus coucang TaxID=9470 RepID=UPI00234DA714|nr:interleukin-15 receptor subunit alpha isoform X2 [Nycticebus coucang]